MKPIDLDKLCRNAHARGLTLWWTPSGFVLVSEDGREEVARC